MEQKPIKAYRDLNIFRLSYSSAMDIFQLEKKSPKEEIYSLTDQFRDKILNHLGLHSPSLAASFPRASLSGRQAFLSGRQALSGNVVQEASIPNRSVRE